MRWLLFSLALIVGSAQSQERPANDVQKSKANTSNATKKLEDEKQGTEKNPLVVKRIDAEETSERREQMRAEREGKTANERSMVIWTITLAGATIAFVLIAAGQLEMFRRQLKIMREGADDAKDLAKAAKANADAAKNTADATNIQFHLTNRPKLIVRWIYLIDERTIQYEVTNVGRVGAEIMALHAEICLNKLPALSPYTNKDVVSVPLIHAGESRNFQKIVIEQDAVDEFQMELGWNEGIAEDPQAGDVRKMYFLGYISYKDQSIGIGHRTAFCRLYDYRKRRFLPMPDADPDYEHAD